MYDRIDDFESDPSWKPSVGEQFWKLHFRNGKDHAVCDPTTGNCSIHSDKDDPHESLESLLKHLADNKVVKGVAVGATVTGVALLLDELLNDGKGRKSIKKALFG